MAGPFLRINTLNRKLLRDLWKSKGQAIAVTAVILCGIADYVCVSSAYRNLKLTRDTYYREYRLADFWIPLERAPKSAVYKVEAIPGVIRARGRIVKDVNLDIAGSNDPKIGRIVSMPDKPKTVLNDFCLVKGRYFSSDALDEVILSDRFAKANNLRVGDRIRATINTRKETLRIVGTALSPEYVYMIRNAQEFIPNDRGFGVLFVKETFAEMILDMRDACNEIVGAVDNPEQLDAVFDRAKQILEPYGVLATIKQYDQLSNRFLSDEITGLGVAAKIDPAIFLGIAAMILMLMLERMVKRERTEIGVLKAYGYTDLAIVGHYLKFASLVAVAGWLGGMAVGQWLGQWIIRMYQQFYQFPLLRYRFYGDVLGLSLLIAVVAGWLGASVAVVRVLRISPAEAMRPEAPRLGGAILLERIGWFWRRASFSWKMLLRNMARYKIRAAVTIFGVAMATAILIIGRFATDSMDRLMQHQFRDVQRQDIKVTFVLERGQEAIGDLRRLDHVRHVEPLFEYPFEVRTGWRKKELLITGMRADTRMFRLLDTEGRSIELADEGLTMTERTAHELGLRAGDQIELQPMIGKVKKVRTVTVRPPVRQYLGTGAYMNLDALSRLMDENLAVNAALLQIDRGAERLLTRRLKDIPAIAGVEIKENSLISFEKTLAASMAIMNAILLTFAGVIAFAIIYNATSITITERSRELTSLRVLGFSLDEVGGIVFRENWLLSVVGVAAGVPLGLGLCRLLILAYETDLYRLPFAVRNRTFVMTVASIAVFVALANWTSRRRLAGLDMVEVLKSRE
jgi:putative ABC transport system permease protein